MSIELEIYKNLYHFDLDVQFKIDNEILAIVGESGSGKTMILKNIAGIEKPDRGYIVNNSTTFFSSKDNIELEVRKRKVGFLFQNYALFPHLSVMDNLKIVFDKKDIDEDYIMELLNTFKVGHLVNMKPGEISGGEKQRVALARMICANPEIILMDEPFSALDTNLKWEIESELTCFLRKYGKPVIFVTHNMDEALRISDKVLLIDRGKIIDFGDKKEVLKPKSAEAAKLLGYKNILDRDDGQGKIILDSKKFRLDKQEDDMEMKVSLKYCTEDSSYYVLVFSLMEDELRTVTAEMEKNQINLEHIEKHLNKDRSISRIYYPKEEIISV